MRYTLDLSGVNKKHLPVWWVPGLTQLPIEDGRHERDYDVIEKDVDPAKLLDFKQRLYAFLEKKYPHVNFTKAKELPLGIDKDKLPKGARIIPA